MNGERNATKALFGVSVQGEVIGTVRRAENGKVFFKAHFPVRRKKRDGTVETVESYLSGRIDSEMAVVESLLSLAEAEGVIDLQALQPSDLAKVDPDERRKVKVPKNLLSSFSKEEKSKSK